MEICKVIKYIKSNFKMAGVMNREKAARYLLAPSFEI